MGKGLEYDSRFLAVYGLMKQPVSPHPTPTRKPRTHSIYSVFCTLLTHHVLGFAYRHHSLWLFHWVSG
ncbi:hypothetical protein AcetOrient_orf03837 [Acetobacter orientalis]|uniref:Uncharacterized protein n=1 Tax=Acetobacter orientalis TaxID=146474 RepID=A0A2Z5ZK55_9PROT|nr:hypothetical protein AcetOrient_orf03837 [Acetobacter orientalis]